MRKVSQDTTQHPVLITNEEEKMVTEEEKKRAIKEKLMPELISLGEEALKTGEYVFHKEGPLYLEVLETTNWMLVINYMEAKKAFLYNSTKVEIYEEELAGKTLSASDRKIIDEVLFPLRESIPSLGH